VSPISLLLVPPPLLLPILVVFSTLELPMLELLVTLQPLASPALLLLGLLPFELLLLLSMELQPGQLEGLRQERRVPRRAPLGRPSAHDPFQPILDFTLFDSKLYFHQLLGLPVPDPQDRNRHELQLGRSQGHSPLAFLLLS